VSDSRLDTLRKADETEIEAAQKRYQLISDTIDDTVSKLQKIVDAGENSLRGKWVDSVKDDAKSIKESLAKAAVRYRDAANEIKKYEPELHTAITEVNTAERDESEASAALSQADAMPDPQKDADGNIPPAEQQKGDDKQRARDNANAKITAAKSRLTAALDALDVAGKRLGDAVNCENYDDGLTDKMNWRLMNVFKMISKIFGIVAMILTAFAIMIPGLGWLALAAVAVSVVVLVADSVLLAGGDGSVLSVVLGAFGVAFGGIGAAIGLLGKSIGRIGDFVKNMSKIKFNPNWKPGGQSIELVNFGKPPALTGNGGWFGNMGAAWNKWFGNGFGGWLKTWWDGFIGMKAIRDLSFLKNFPLFGEIFSKAGGGLQVILATWGGVNQLFAVVSGLFIAGLQATEHHSLKDA
jgi:hypothetical protein